MKILLIRPSLTGNLSSGIYTIKVPLNLAYIAGYLEKKGYKPEILDCLAYYEKIQDIDGEKRVGLSDKKIEEKIREISPDIVGLSCSYTVYEKDSFRVSKIVKKVNKKILVVVGGAHSSANPKSVLKSKDIDIAVIGEGEETFFDIVKNFDKKRKLKNIKGTAIRQGKKIKINKPREFIENLDDIPFPARHLLPMEKYLNHPENAIANMRSPTSEIISSRGCPFNCIFCSIKTVWGNKWRARSAKNVVDEVEMLNKKYKIKEFRFFDDNLTWDKKRIMKMCDEIIKRKLNIKWDTPNGVAISTLDEEVLKKMKQSGYYRIVMGIESGSEKTLRFIRKPHKLEKAKEVIKICNKLGIWTWSTFVIGFPYEKKEDIEKTIDFAKKSGLNFATFYIAQPYAGTELYDIFDKEGLLEKGLDKHSSVVHTQYDTLNFKAEELRKLHQKAYQEFIKYKFISFLNPLTFYREFLNRIKSFEDLKFVVKMFSKLWKKEYLPSERKIKN